MARYKLEPGKTYKRLDGQEFQVRRIYENEEMAYCSDSWNRFINGEFAGRFCGKEHVEDYPKHTDWSLLRDNRQRQLTLL